MFTINRIHNAKLLLHTKQILEAKRRKYIAEDIVFHFAKQREIRAHSYVSRNRWQ